MKHSIALLLLSLGMPTGCISDPLDQYVIYYDGDAMETEIVRDNSPDGMFTDIHASLGNPEFATVYFSTGLEPKPLPERFITSDVFENLDGRSFLGFRGAENGHEWNGAVFLNASVSDIQDDNDYFRKILEDVSMLSICLTENLCSPIEVSENIRPEVSVSVPDPG